MSATRTKRSKAVRERRQQVVQELAALRAERSPAEQIKLLDTRLGKGVGAKRERARLKDQIAAAIAVEVAKPESNSVKRRKKAQSGK